MSVKTPIHDFLKNYASSGAVRVHMPGAKSNPFDITEIEGADELYDSKGIIAQSESVASSLFHSGKTLFSCGGSTLAIQTMLALAKAQFPQKNLVIAPRFCHKSLINSCVLLDLRADWVFPDEFLSCEISAKAVEEKICDATLCVFAQSVDYLGGECDVKSLADVCERHNIPLLVDNAHGAYKVFTGDHPLSLGADMTADSAHKTLPCATGGAYLHISENTRWDFASRAKETMSLFGSSSPSYLVMESLDLCNKHIAEEKDSALKILQAVKKLKSDLTVTGFKLKKSDPMRIVVDAAERGFSGFELSALLREEGVSCEFCDEYYTVMLFSTGQKKDDFAKILAAFSNIPRKDPLKKKEHARLRPTAPLSPREAFFSPRAEVNVADAEGLVCAAAVCSCPPCVPLIMPGEMFGGSAIEELKRYGIKKVWTVKKRT